MRETWVAVEDYPNYEVSDQGRVRNVVGERLLVPREHNRGYQRVTLCHEGSCREFYIHKLVALTFYRWSIEEQTIHYDGDLSNNSLSNLYLRKRVRRETRTRPLEGSESEEFRRQWGKPIRIVETDERFRSVRDCAEYINGDYSSIYAVLRGQRSQHRGFTFEYY